MGETITETASAKPNLLQPKKQLMLNGYSAIQYCSAGLNTGSCYTEETELIFVIEGIFNMRYGNEYFEIEAHNVILVKKNIWVEYLPACNDSCNHLEYIRFTIKYELVKEFTKLAALSTVETEEQMPIIVKEESLGWISYVNSLFAIMAEYNKPDGGLVKIKMLELLYHLYNMDKCLLEHILDVRKHFRTNITATVEDNITNIVSMGQLAKLSGRSLSSFRRDFLAIYNMPPSQWIRLKRLEKAKELLLGTSMTITDICYTLGFESIEHFSRVFKSHFGYPPSLHKLNHLLSRPTSGAATL